MYLLDKITGTLRPLKRTVRACVGVELRHATAKTASKNPTNNMQTVWLSDWNNTICGESICCYNAGRLHNNRAVGARRPDSQILLGNRRCLLPGSSEIVILH